MQARGDRLSVIPSWGVTEPFLEIGGKYFLPSNGRVDKVCLGVSSWVLKPMQGPMNSHFCSGETLYLMKILGEDALHIGQSGVTSGVFAVLLEWTGPFLLHLNLSRYYSGLKKGCF